MECVTPFLYGTGSGKYIAWLILDWHASDRSKTFIDLRGRGPTYLWIHHGTLPSSYDRPTGRQF